MAKHSIRANTRKQLPETTIQAAPSFYERTHPVGSAERFLDTAAKEALVAAAAGGLPSPKQFVPGAVRAVAKETEKYPDPLFAEAARLPREELLRRAARAEAYQKAMEVQNEVVRAASTAMSPAGNMAANQAGAVAHDALTRQAAKGGDARSDTKPTETFDTPIPKELQAKYDAWYAQLPENLQHTGDYDLQGAWLERLGQPDKYEAAQNGHLDDYGKKPNHVTFSTGSKWHDPSVPERTGGEWRQAKDGSWDFYPGTGNKASDDELKAYFDKYEKGNRVHRREVRQDAEGGNAAGSGTAVSETPVSEASQNPGGPRIVINPTTFHNKKDALCVAFNEGFRVWMEANGFEPQSEPTDAQRKFFSDTAYADDEVQLRRTILARIATFDTSVKDPTDDQLSETASFLNAVLESDWCKNEWERDSVSRLMNAVQSAVGAEPVEPRQEPLEAREAEPLQRHAAMGGGETEDEEDKAPVQEPSREAKAADTMNAIYEIAGVDKVVTEDDVRAINDKGGAGPADQPEPEAGRAADASQETDSGSIPSSPADSTQESAPAGQGGTSDLSYDEMADAQRKLSSIRGQQRESAETRALEESADAMRKPLDQEGTRKVEESGKRLLDSVEPAAGSATARDERAGRTPEASDTQRQENPQPDDGRLRAGIDRSEFGKNGHIGIGARIVDPVTGKSRSSLSMNGPAIKPARAIGDMGSRSLTDSKSMNGPAIEPVRAIGDMGSHSLTDTKSMNGPSLTPTRQIGDMGATSLTDSKSMNGPAIDPSRPVGDVGSRSLTDSKSMNGPALKPRRRIGDMGGRTLANNRRRR